MAETPTPNELQYNKDIRYAPDLATVKQAVSEIIDRYPHKDEVIIKYTRDDRGYEIEVLTPVS